MRRQPSPADRSGKAKLIQPFGIVVRNAPCQHLPLPGVGGNFKSLQLAKYLKRGALALHLRSQGNMLPAQQPAHELRRCDRLDLLAQSCDSQPMNARQQPAVAPFVLVLLVWRGPALSEAEWRPRPRSSARELSS